MHKTFLKTFCLSLLALIACNTWAQNVAKIGTTEYATFAEALSVVQDGDVIYLLDDADASTVAFTHCNGKHVVIAGSTGTETLNMGTGAKGGLSNADITFLNLKMQIRHNPTTGTWYTQNLYHPAKVKYENVTFDGVVATGDYVEFLNCTFASNPQGMEYTLWNYGGTIVVDGCTFSADAAGTKSYIKQYAEPAGSLATNLVITNTTFGKPANELGKGCYVYNSTNNHAQSKMYVDNDVIVKYSDACESKFTVYSSAAEMGITLPAPTILASIADLEISTADELMAFAESVNKGNAWKGKTVALTADINLTGYKWTAIGNVTAYPSISFAGTFDGQGYTISNLTCVDNTQNYACAGFFGSVNGGTIQNVTLKNVYIRSTHYAGGICAYSSNEHTKIINCSVSGGAIKSTPELINGSYDNGDKVGGIMGYGVAGNTIEKCTVENVTISAYRDLGGIAGCVGGALTSCTVTGCTIIQDNTNAYKESVTTYAEIVGRDNGIISTEPTTAGNILKQTGLAVAKIGDVGYKTLAEAVTAAKAGDVVEIVEADTYKLPNIPNNITIKGAVDGVVFDCVGSGSIASVPSGATFENVTFNMGQSSYHGFQHAGIINMKDCIINGLFFSYGDMNFTDCKFVQDRVDYNMWDYGQNLTYTNCEFEGYGKFLNIYNEGNGNWDLTVKGCTFTNKGESKKAAINIKETCVKQDETILLGWNVEIDDTNTLVGNFPANSTSDALVVGGDGLWQVDDRYIEDPSVSLVTVRDDKGTVLYSATSIPFAENEIIITTAEELVAFAEYVNDGQSMAGQTIKLGADIDMTGVTMQPIGTGTTFCGTFDGQHYAVSNLSMDCAQNNVGLFGTVWDAEIKDVSLTNVNIKNAGADYTGGIAGHGYANISGCTVTGTIQGVEQVGGVIGYLNCGYVTNCNVDVKVIATESRAGGIAGKANVDSEYHINNNTIKCEVSSPDIYAGGIVGQIMATDNNIYEIKDNEITAFTISNGGNVIGNVRNGSFVSSLASNITGNKWYPAGGVATITDGTNTLDIPNANKLVAKIGDEEYATLAEAIAAVKDGETITMLTDVKGANGISVPSGKNFTVDFDGYTYTFGGDGAGSANTKTSGFQLLKDSKITFKNGTINCSEANKDRTWAKADTEKGIAMLIQNYADLTLDGMTIDGANIAHNGAATRYVLSNNSGDVHYTGATTITANEGDIAFDAYKGASYDAPIVTIDDAQVTINGNVEAAGGKLVISAGMVNGTISTADGYAQGDITISGGFFSEVVPDEYCAMGYEPVTEADVQSMYTVTINDVVLHVYGFANSPEPKDMTIPEFLKAQQAYPNAMAVTDAANAEDVAELHNVVLDYAIGKGHYYECENFIIDDMADFWYSPVSFYAVAGNYTRKKLTLYNSVCVPFEVTADNAPSGAKFLQYRYSDNKNTNVYFEIQNHVSAGQGFVMQATAGEDWTVDFDNTYINNTIITGAMSGSYETRTIGAGFFKVNSKGDKFAKTAASSKVYPFRSYLDQTGEILGGAPEASSLSIVIDEQDTTTGIYAATRDDIQSIYGLNGVKRNVLQRGVNIAHTSDGYKKIIK